MSDKIKKGKEAEDMAADFLKAIGYEIVERNYRHRRSEIDLIVRKEKWLVFVEVKMRSSDAFGYPEEFVDYKKAKNIVYGAEQYTFAKARACSELACAYYLTGSTEQANTMFKDAATLASSIKDDAHKMITEHDDEHHHSH